MYYDQEFIDDAADKLYKMLAERNVDPETVCVISYDDGIQSNSVVIERFTIKREEK
ncbi:hypothetical protein MARVELLAND_158 [Bacillus phage vB_BspM_MarvelLand]|nr:hypothetical protein MARVELLAND_158 [Bacillus phage vB_BspM_MarvelLand]